MLILECTVLIELNKLKVRTHHRHVSITCIHVADALSVMVSLTPIPLTISWTLDDGLMVESYTLSYVNMDCSSDLDDDITGIAGEMTMYTLTGLEEGTEYSITVTATLTGGRAGADTERATTVTIGILHCLSSLI